jgi:hypothetical protein
MRVDGRRSHNGVVTRIRAETTSSPLARISAMSTGRLEAFQRRHLRDRDHILVLEIPVPNVEHGGLANVPLDEWPVYSGVGSGQPSHLRGRRWGTRSRPTLMSASIRFPRGSVGGHRIQPAFRVHAFRA